MYINVMDVIVNDVLCSFPGSAFKCPINGSDNLCLYINLAVVLFNGSNIVIGSNMHFVHVY